MCELSIAVQLFSIREDAEKDFAGTLKKVKEMGYDGVELAGIYGYSAAEVKQMCSEAGLTPISAHVSLAELEIGEKTFKTYEEIGCKYIVLAWIEPCYLAGGEKFEEFVAKLTFFGDLAKKHGMKLCYHNHDSEFNKINDEYKLDLMYQSVPSDLLFTEFDTAWVNTGGENPVDYIRKYADRTEIIHLKDFVGKKNEKMYALKNTDNAKAEKLAGDFDFRPVGSGLQNIPSILDAAKEVNAKWLVVEQDLPCLNKTPIECAAESIHYLRSISGAKN